MVLTTEEVCCVGSVRMAMVPLFIYLINCVPIVQVSGQDMSFLFFQFVPTTLFFPFDSASLQAHCWDMYFSARQ